MMWYGIIMIIVFIVVSIALGCVLRDQELDIGDYATIAFCVISVSIVWPLLFLALVIALLLDIGRNIGEKYQL